MKKKIEEALSAEYKGLGLSDKTIGRLADYLLGSVEKEEDIATAVKGDAVKLLATSIQGEIAGLKRAKETAETALADYKAKHPEQTETKKTEETEETKKTEEEPDLAAKIAAAVAEAINPLKESFETYKAQTSAKEAKGVAKAAFYGNKWTERYKTEADDAWERAAELNEAQGGKMTAEELQNKAMDFFTKYVKRKGADPTKPIESDEGGDVPDFTDMQKHLEEAGLLDAQTDTKE